MTSRRISVLVLLVLAALLGTALFAWQGQTIAVGPQAIEQAVSPGGTATVQTRVLSCPVMQAREAAAERDATVEQAATVSVPPPAEGVDVPASLSLGWSGDDQVKQTDLPGAWLQSRAGLRVASAVVTARGALAASTVALRSYLDGGGEGRGLAATTCGPAGDDFWFVGTSGLVGTRDRLLLHNPTGAPAVVHVDLFGADGPYQVAGAGGIVLQPGAEADLPIDAWIPGVPRASIRVTTQSGLVSAMVLSTRIDGVVPQGVAFLGAAEPDRTPQIPVGVANASVSEVTVHAIGGPAAVSLRLLTAEGAAEVPLADTRVIRADSTSTIDITDALAGRVGVVSVEADQPVVASLRQVVDKAGKPPTFAPPGVRVRDQVMTAAVASLTGLGVLPLAGVPDSRSWVVLGSRGGPATVAVDVLGAERDGGRGRTLQIAADSAVRVALPSREGGGPAVVTLRVVAGEGEVTAGVVQSVDGGGGLVTAGTVQPLSGQVTVPVSSPGALTGP